jgi:hypothetical protein
VDRVECERIILCDVVSNFGAHFNSSVVSFFLFRHSHASLYEISVILLLSNHIVVFSHGLMHVALHYIMFFAES